MKIKPIVGRRIIKTGISVFITALVCLYFNLPAQFAVIAAIVTIEPTASDSIKKGLVRLPASAIGAALAVTFVSIWGQSAFSFTGAAVLTIFICQKLKLHDGILVATLTAVAMVPDIYDHFFLTFLSRLGTTAIGITVSSLVNFFILPPKFTPQIIEKFYPSFRLASEVLVETTRKILLLKQTKSYAPSKQYIELRYSNEKVSELFSFQEREWKYHRIKLSEYRAFHRLKRANTAMQKIVLHLGNLQYINEPGYFSELEEQLVKDIVNSINAILISEAKNIPDSHYFLINELDQHLKFEGSKIFESTEYVHRFTTKRILYFELLSIHDSLEELHHI
ncbi:aromatic acid exporter family protein [Bacillaceae bacterium IKA-2]|nr:aromatic acid exporter family protein [Bacillaceae bacterium IKA-2]